MRLSSVVSLVFSTACGSTTLRYVPAQTSAVPPVARAELTEATAEELLAEGWAQVGWIYRHSTRGNERSGTEEMLIEAARRGGERVRMVQARRSTERVTASVVGSNYATYTAAGTRGHIRRIGEVWRRDPALAAQQLEARSKVESDPVIARLRSSCAANDASACHALAEEHRAARRIAPSNQSVELDRKACALGLAEACSSVARKGLLEVRRPELSSRAIESARRGCELGAEVSCAIAPLLEAYRRGPDASDHQRATQLGLEWCERGDIDACDFAASRFASTAHGKYGPTDQARADRLYARKRELVRDACLQRSEVTRCESMLYSVSEGSERDELRRRVAERMEPLCADGMIYACFRLARQYYDDRFPEERRARAVELFEAGCEAGIGEACMLSGSAYARGRGVGVDPRRAAARRAQGCALGHPSACSALENRD